MNKISAVIIAVLTIAANTIGYFQGVITIGEVLIIYMLVGIFINTFKEIE